MGMMGLVLSWVPSSSWNANRIENVQIIFSFSQEEIDQLIVGFTIFHGNSG